MAVTLNPSPTPYFGQLVSNSSVHPSSSFRVNLGDRSYSIAFEKSFDNLTRVLNEADCRGPFVVITNETIAPLYLELLLQNLGDPTTHSLVLPDGEKYKNLDSYHRVMSFLIENGCQRDVTLIALGGGVIGDLSGFVAATYQRGVRFIQVPTTLLAQVDSSVGGKTAVNHELGKNLIGAFHQPQLVFMNLSTLETLPPREFSAGLAEVVKAAIIADESFFSWLEERATSILEHDFSTLKHLVETSCRIKAKVVEKDEREQGQRALLNLGHTFGHAIESWYQYERYLHGETVAIGLCLAARLALDLTMIPATTVARIENLLTGLNLPTRLEENLDAEAFLSHMLRDKKNIGQGVTLILPECIGQCQVVKHFGIEELTRFLRTAL